MFNLFKRNKIRLQVVFHQDVAGHVVHGSLWASNKTLGVENSPILFSFVGVNTAPHLDRAMFNYIIDKAEASGWVVKGLRSYAGLFQTQGAKVSMESVRAMVKETPNAKALRAHYDEQRSLQPPGEVLDMSGLVGSPQSLLQGLRRGVRDAGTGDTTVTGVRRHHSA